MTSEQLAEIEARAAAATPGPWGTMDGAPWNVLDASGCRILWVNRDDYHSESTAQDERDAAFLAHARQDVENLTSEVRFLTARNNFLLAEVQYLSATVRDLEPELTTARLMQAEARDAAALMQAENARLREAFNTLEIGYQQEKERRKEAEAEMRAMAQDPNPGHVIRKELERDPTNDLGPERA